MRHKFHLTPLIARFSVFNTNTKHVRWGINCSGRIPEDDMGDVQEFLSAIYSREAITEIKMKAGDLLVVDNLRMLHGRKSFKGNRHYVRVRYW